jgi:uncharacterized protein YukE
MADFFGADVGELRHLSIQMRQASTQLSEIALRLGSQVSQVRWTGPSAQRFVSDWHTRLGPDLRMTSQSLIEAAERASSNAGQQEEASHR